MTASSPIPANSIQRKLRRVVFTASLVSILLTVLGFVTYEVLTYPGKFVTSLKSTGEIIGANSTAALAFDNRQDAADVIRALQAQPRIISAAIYDKNGELFVTYARDSVHSLIPMHAAQDGSQFAGGRLELFMPIRLRDARVGTLFIAADLEGIYSRFRSYGVIAFFVILGSLTIAMATASRMQRKIATPILD